MNEKPYIGSRVLPQGRTGMTKELPGACCLLTSSQSKDENPLSLHMNLYKDPARTAQ
jgi:hypothetical protein